MPGQLFQIFILEFSKLQCFHVVGVHGRWSRWSPWSKCSVKCGGGVRVSKRNCSTPQNGGKTCVGPNTRTIMCNIQACQRKFVAFITSYYKHFVDKPTRTTWFELTFRKSALFCRMFYLVQKYCSCYIKK